MKGKDLLTVGDLEPEEVRQMIQDAEQMKKGERPRPLEGKVFALLFEKPSLRTRASFEVGIRQMGGDCFYMSKDDVGLGVREPESDIARVLDRLVDGIVARVFSHRSLEILAEHASIPVINALSDLAHPCQAIGDILTIHEHKGALEGLSVAFVGDGNNIAGSLALACASVGADFVIASPRDYQIPSIVLEEAKQRAGLAESRVDWVERPEVAVRQADVVYTDVWVSMGQEGEAEQRERDFEGYCIDVELLGKAAPGAIVMHCLPAYRGMEITDEVIDGPQSVVFDQAENRLHAQRALLQLLLG